MSSGRPGATALQAASDYFTTTAAVGPPVKLPPLPFPEIDLDAIDAAARIIAAARAPMLIVGSGALDASPEVTALAEMIGAPVVSFRGGRGVVSNDHPLGLTIGSAQRLWPQTDVAIVIGSRFELLDMRWRYRPAGFANRPYRHRSRRVASVTRYSWHRWPTAAAGARALAAALDKHGVPNTARQPRSRPPARKRRERMQIHPTAGRLSARDPRCPAAQRLLRGRNLPDGISRPCLPSRCTSRAPS